MNNNLTKIGGGLLMIVFGGLWIASNFIEGFNLNWNYVWPLFLIIPGVSMWAKYLIDSTRPRRYEILIPANILLLIGGIFYLNIILSDVFALQGVWVATAFMYPAAVSLAFVITWWVSGREITLLIPAVVMGLISILAMCATATIALLGGQAAQDINKILWPLLIIGLGIFVLLSPLWSGNSLKSSKIMGKTIKEWEKWGDDLEQKFESDLQKSNPSHTTDSYPNHKSDVDGLQQADEIDIANAEEAQIVDDQTSAGK